MKAEQVLSHTTMLSVSEYNFLISSFENKIFKNELNLREIGFFVFL